MGGVIARETDGSPLFEARDPEFATPGESNNLLLPPADLNGDSVINHLDLLEFLRQYRDQEEGKAVGSADSESGRLHRWLGSVLVPGPMGSQAVIPQVPRSRKVDFTNRS